MASNTLKRQSGMATVAGTTIYTVPANTTLRLRLINQIQFQ